MTAASTRNVLATTDTPARNWLRNWEPLSFAPTSASRRKSATTTPPIWALAESAARGQTRHFLAQPPTRNAQRISCTACSRNPRRFRQSRKPWPRDRKENTAMNHDEPRTRRYEPRFELGLVVSTPGALEACSNVQMQPMPRPSSDRRLGLCLRRRTGKPTTTRCPEESAFFPPIPSTPRKPCEGFGEKHALDNHRGRQERDHVPVAGRILTTPQEGNPALPAFFNPKPNQKENYHDTRLSKYPSTSSSRSRATSARRRTSVSSRNLPPASGRTACSKILS